MATNVFFYDLQTVFSVGLFMILLEVIISATWGSSSMDAARVGGKTKKTKIMHIFMKVEKKD